MTGSFVMPATVVAMF